ncbi:MAG: AarF/ABC1/UbiB kinase family protein [Myxococcota bacterium]
MSAASSTPPAPAASGEATPSAARDRVHTRATPAASTALPWVSAALAQDRPDAVGHGKFPSHVLDNNPRSASGPRSASVLACRRTCPGRRVRASGRGRLRSDRPRGGGRRVARPGPQGPPPRRPPGRRQGPLPRRPRPLPHRPQGRRLGQCRPPPPFPGQHLERVHDQLGSMLAAESDLRIEARALHTMGQAFAGAPDVVLPKVVRELSGASVLVMDWVDGVRLTDRQALADLGVTPHDAARKLLDVFFRQVFEHRFVHADPHPGNFLVQRAADGSVKIALLDLGSATAVREPLVKGLVQVLGATFAKDEAGILAGLETMGFVASGGDRAQLLEAIKKGLGGIDPAAFGNASKTNLGTSFDRKEARAIAKAVTYPDGWLPLERAIMLVGATCASEAPELSPAQVAFPHVARFLAAERSRRAA